MAMNHLIVLLAIASTYSINVTRDLQQFVNNTFNGSDIRKTSDNYNATDEFDELDERHDVSRNFFGFWNAWEEQNGSYFETYTLVPPLDRRKSVTDNFTVEFYSEEFTEMTNGISGDIEMTTPTPEVQLSKPLSDLWPVKLAAEVPGDLIIGGLMMVHEREDTITCGPIMPQGGIQAVETMLYTLDIVNKGLDHFSIGVHILDDCDKDTYGLEMAVDFIKGILYEQVIITLIGYYKSIPRNRTFLL